MSKVKVRIEGHYELQEIPYGKDYVWVRPTRSSSVAIPRCMLARGEVHYPACGSAVLPIEPDSKSL